MIEGKSVLAVIPARGGSKGLPGKNLRLLGGKPMLAWTVEAALATPYLDRVVLSTDDEGIMAVGRAAGCEVPFRRPTELATDDASIYDVLHHAAGQLDQPYDIIVLLQPTSPLRRAADIAAALELRETCAAPSVVSVTRATKPLHWHYHIDEQRRLLPAIQGDQIDRRQLAQPSFTVNGAMYAAARDWLFEHMSYYRDETVAYEMPPERSVDVDTMMDFVFAQTLLTEGLARASA